MAQQRFYHNFQVPLVDCNSTIPDDFDCNMTLDDILASDIYQPFEICSMSEASTHSSRYKHVVKQTHNYSCY